MCSKSIVNNSVIACDESINVRNVALKNVTNGISTNVMSTAPISFHNKKVRHKMDYCILHTFLLVTISSFAIIMQNLGQN